MRELTGHKVNGCNDGLKVEVLDEPGSGGANHRYQVSLGDKPTQFYLLQFQNGPIREVGTNGLTHEVLLSILIDRLEGFQGGKFACAANAAALDHLKAAQESLLSRTRERLARGVEGTHSV